MARTTYIGSFFPPTQRPTSGARIGNNSASSGFDALRAIAGIETLPFAVPTQFSGHSAVCDGTYWHEVNWGNPPVPFLLAYRESDLGGDLSEVEPLYLILDWGLNPIAFAKEVQICKRVKNIGEMSSEESSSSTGSIQNIFGGWKKCQGGLSGVVTGAVTVSKGHTRTESRSTQTLKGSSWVGVSTSFTDSVFDTSLDGEPTVDYDTFTVVPEQYTASANVVNGSTQNQIPWGDDPPERDCGAFQITESLSAAYFAREFVTNGPISSGGGSYVTWLFVSYYTFYRMVDANEWGGITAGDTTGGYTLYTPGGSIPLDNRAAGLILAWSNQPPDDDEEDYADSDPDLDTYLFIYVPIHSDDGYPIFGDLHLAYYRGDEKKLYTRTLGAEDGVTREGWDYFITMPDPDDSNKSIKARIFQAIEGTFRSLHDGKDIGLCVPGP